MKTYAMTVSSSALQAWCASCFWIDAWKEERKSERWVSVRRSMRRRKQLAHLQCLSFLTGRHNVHHRPFLGVVAGRSWSKSNAEADLAAFSDFSTPGPASLLRLDQEASFLTSNQPATLASHVSRIRRRSSRPGRLIPRVRRRVPRCHR